MSATARPVLTGTRLSELAICARRCACRALGHEAAEPGVQQQRYMSRGNLFESYVSAQFAAKYGEHDIERQREIPWSLGIGHADIYVRSEKLIIEVVSTTGGVIDHKIAQARLYLMHDPEAERAAVYVVNPSDLSGEDLLPIHSTDEDIAKLEQRIASVQTAIDTGELPDCVHSSPTGCRFSGCPFYASAWEGWEAPSPVDLTDTPGIISLVADFYHANQACKEADGISEERKRIRDEAKEALAEVLVIPKLPYKAGSFVVSRTHVAGRVTFSYAKACETGAIPPAMQEHLAPFVKVGEGHDRINLRRVSDEPIAAADDYGDVPF